MNDRTTTRRALLSAALGWTGLSLMRPLPLGACPLFHPPTDRCDSQDWMDGGRLMVEGYTTRRSYVAGDIAELCLSSARPLTTAISIHRLGAEAEPVWTGSARVEPQAIPPDASSQGCGWEQGDHGRVIFEIPEGWRTGLYRITMSAPSGMGRRRPGEAWFVVRSSTPGQTSAVLLVLATNTYCAYNNYGWRRSTDGPSTEGSFYDQASQASFLRPLPAGFLSPYECGAEEPLSRLSRFAGWDKWEWPFVRWAERVPVALDYATNEDLERYPDLVRRYRLVLSIGHDEYWSEEMRNALGQYRKAGGNLAFFSGNVCYRRVHLDLSASRMEVMGEMDGEALWSHRRGPNRPENQLTGVSFCYGAINPEPVPYTIYQPQHWLFDGLWPSGATKGSLPQMGCIGYECDGCDIEWAGGRPMATHRDGTPNGFEILGFAPGRMYDYEATVHSKALFGLEDGVTPWGSDLRQGGAVLGTWTDGGTVVTVGCTEWARHLSDPLVAHVTRNILNRLGH